MFSDEFMRCLRSGEFEATLRRVAELPDPKRMEMILILKPAMDELGRAARAIIAHMAQSTNAPEAAQRSWNPDQDVEPPHGA
jgi:hypothetical protein